MSSVETTETAPGQKRRRASTRPAEKKPLPATNPRETASMKVYFEHQADKSRSWLGNVTGMHISGNSIRGPQDREVAYYLGGTWRTADDRFKFVEIQCPVQVELHNDAGESMPLGVVDHLRIADGVMRCGKDLTRQLVRYDQPSRAWRFGQDQSLWPRIVFLPVEEEAA